MVFSIDINNVVRVYRSDENGLQSGGIDLTEALGLDTASRPLVVALGLYQVQTPDRSIFLAYITAAPPDATSGFARPPFFLRLLSPFPPNVIPSSLSSVKDIFSGFRRMEGFELGSFPPFPIAASSAW